ncbi:MAG TPA: Uma2 family endonuclease [Haliscomenobacter sp.]|uniref:Uma2 family endonuclease n=1 Tax=Haliscomenobacter sp. TaxID=2717303 RepID=UPI002BB2C1F7|nr:Uma2 family endonuclease [Haliscomenobacter sp.]HOY15945.1 Uma2 family endonuclease [Haliscomenobacter sp.]HPH17245.1 Uma2 family endonuclease [Haliscomenobacter sp.]
MASTTNSAIQRFKFSTEVYHQLGAYGLLENARIELLNGEIVEMSPINSPHSGTVNRLQKILEKILGNTHLVAIQNPIALGKYSEPQPDIAVLEWRDDFYFDQHPTPAEVFFLIEVADSTLEKDREIKLPLYAQANIQEVWIVNLKTKQLDVYAVPKASTYTKVKTFGPGDQLEGTLVPSLRFDQILPK